MKALLRHIILITTCVQLNSVWAQTVQVDSKFDKKAIYIGEQFLMSLKVTCPGEMSLQFPQFEGDSLIKEIEVIERQKIDTNKTDSAIIYQQNFVLTSFDSGYHAVPPIQVFSPTDTFESQALLIHIKDYPVDTTQQIKAIKDIEAAPAAPKSLLWLWVLLGGLIIVGLLVYFFRNRKTTVIEKKEIKPQIPAHIEALNALKTLAEQKLWQQNKIKEYHSELTDIIRLYLERRFGIPALEQTSDEILNSINRTKIIDTTLSEKLSQVLRLADAAKFAKAKPIAHENEASYNYVEEIINRTKKQELDLDQS